MMAGEQVARLAEGLRLMVARNDDWPGYWAVCNLWGMLDHLPSITVAEALATLQTRETFFFPSPSEYTMREQAAAAVVVRYSGSFTARLATDPYPLAEALVAELALIRLRHG
jgi:hypothetical protein